MKAVRLSRFIVPCLAVLCCFFDGQNRCSAQTNVPFVVGFYYPTNGQTFLAPANVAMHASVTDSNIVETVQYFSGSNSLAIVTNKNNVLLTNTSGANPFEFTWSNVPSGSYTLTAVATDSTGATATSGPVNIIVKSPPSVPFAVGFYSPTNGEVVTDPTNLYVHAWVTDSNIVRTMEYFAGSNLLAIKTNTGTTLFTNSNTGNPFAWSWTNPPPGNYTLTAVATDSTGATATSGPVNITVKAPLPLPFTISFYVPTNGAVYTAPTNVPLYVRVTDSNVIETVQYFAGSNSIAIVTNKSGVMLTNNNVATSLGYVWSNVPPGSYTLTAIATDSAGATATSGPINITVKPPPPIPFAVGFYYPTNNQVFTGPTNIGLHASVTDSNIVETMAYYSGTNLIGTVTNTNNVLLTGTSTGNPFFLLWSNVQPGDYTLTAVATDSAGATATSGPVNITVLSNVLVTNLPIVSIYAPDPVAVEGTNSEGGTNTATFLVRRDSGTNTSLTVYYSISGTASNGVDYANIPNNVTLSPGQRYGTITIYPLEDNDSSTNRYSNVILSLMQPPGVTNSASATYQVGTPAKAGAVILEENVLPITRPLLHNFVDHSVHVSLPATNGMNFCLQYSSNFVDWTTVCTNTVLKGSAQFVDPDACNRSGGLYRIIRAAGPAVY